ncbi:MAG: hypothetical protein V1743_06195 [Nanoarchaeota archaeon]
MNLTKAITFSNEIANVCSDYIRDTYLSQFRTPEIEFDGPSVYQGGYHDRQNKIVIGKFGRCLAVRLNFIIRHELGHAVVHQMNPEVVHIDFYNGDVRSLSEGLAQVIEKELRTPLETAGLFSSDRSSQVLYRLLAHTSPCYWIDYYQGQHLPARQGERSVRQLIAKGKTLHEIISAIPDQSFQQSIPFTCKPKWSVPLLEEDAEFRGWKAIDRLHQSITAV